MAGFPTFTVSQLADFSGRQLIDYTPYADQALMQATVVLMLVTELRDWPIDPFSQNVAQLGILHYAEVLTLEQPYQEAAHSPFQTQTVGSTSFSKPVAYMRGNAQANALRGEQTGITWFDYAVQLLAQRTQFGGVFGNALKMRMDEGMVRHNHETGEIEIVGPEDRDTSIDIFGFNVNSDSSFPSSDGGGRGWGGMQN